MASTALPPASLAVSDRGYARCIKLSRCREVCAFCFLTLDSLPSSSSPASFTPCPDCRVAHYCSPACAHSSLPYHTTECRMLAEVGRLSRHHDVDADLLQMLASVCGRHHRELHRAQFPAVDMRTTPVERLSHRPGEDDELVSRVEAHTQSQLLVACSGAGMR